MKNKLLVTILLMVVLSSLFVVKTFATETGGEAGTGGAGTTEEWTDFSKAKYEMKIERRAGLNTPALHIKNVTFKSGSHYYYEITRNETDVLELKDINKAITINSTDGDMWIDNYYELSGDMYLWIREWNSDNSSSEKVLVSGQKIERVDNNPQYSKAFTSTYMTEERFQICLEYCKAYGTNRKANIKVGKINDQALLRKIKNNESGAWQELLEYAKTSNAIVNKNLTTENGSVFCFAGEGNEGFGISNSEIAAGAYYYLYVDIDSENGKYYPVGPAVTLAIAEKPMGIFGLFFYGSNDFKWELPEELPTEEEPAKEQPKEEEKKDETIAKEKMPNTGLTYIVTLAIGTVTVLGAVAYKKHNNLRGI